MGLDVEKGFEVLRRVMLPMGESFDMDSVKIGDEVAFLEKKGFPLIEMVVDSTEETNSGKKITGHTKENPHEVYSIVLETETEEFILL